MFFLLGSRDGSTNQKRCVEESGSTRENFIAHAVKSRFCYIPSLRQQRQQLLTISLSTMTLSQSSSATPTPAPLDSAWPPAHILETMGTADRASWLGQIQRDRARRLEMDVAGTDLRHRRPRLDLQDDDILEENREPPPEVKPTIDIFPGVSDSPPPFLLAFSRGS